ncbi:MAG: phospholipase D-like domain-containing protein [Candidatus Bathyarchaeota archaeon]|nr:phospholipase D-like domain-containing protein [Candidatus Bathyarchaeota archaeon]
MAPKEIKHLFTEKGEVISAIVIYGARTFQGIDSILHQVAMYRWTDLHILLGELIQEGDVFLNESGEYGVRPELEADYNYFEEHMGEWLEPPMECEYPDNYVDPEPKYPDIITNTESWVKLHKPEIVFNQEHFYLDGHYLDSFTRFILTNAFNTVIVVNPFFDLSTPTQLMIKAKQNGKTVVLVTRPPRGSHFKKLHKIMEEKGVTLLYHNDLHAKVIVIDDLLAVVSSMNFKQRASAGITWEAGIVTVNKAIVNSIKSSIADLNLQPIK